MNGALLHRVVFAVVVVSLLAVAVRLAWLGDDVFITLRTVENCARGDGLRWNVADRALINTHPLWMLLLVVGRWLTGEVYFTTIVLSLVVATAACVLLLRRATTIPALVATACLLLTARAFTEYCTSGLEPPLSSLLLVVLVAVTTGPLAGERRFVATVMIASLLALTRMDLVLLAAPAVLAACRGVPLRRVLLLGFAAGAPLLVWLAFATVYFGTPLPVTAHAKAFGLGIPAGALLVQGLYFVWHTATDDPVLVATTLVGLLIGLRERTTRWLALGALLYLAYVVKVGGDFMAGRFFVPPFVVAVALLATRMSRTSGRAPWVVAVLAVAAMFVRGVPAWLRSPASDTPPDVSAEAIGATRGIVDERRIYYAQLGLLSPTRTIPRFGSLHDVVWPEGRQQPWILLNGAVGVAGFQVGRLGHMLDPILCDPLLTRLPARDPQRWRIGHVLRRIPEGYWETIASGENRLHHPGLRAYVDALQAITQAPVFTAERWSAMRRMAFGELDDGLRAFVADEYYTPPRLDVVLAALPPELPVGSYWFDEPRLVLVYEGGLAVKLGAARRARSMRVQTLGMVAFRFRFVRGDTVDGEAIARRFENPAGVSPLRAVAGLRNEVVDVPPHTGEFDTIWIDPVEIPGSDLATGPPALGAIVFVD